MAAIELDYIKDLLIKVHTTTTPKAFPADNGKLESIDDTSRILVFPGEIIDVDLDIITKRYKIQIEEASELLMMAAINNIIDGLEDMSNGIAITSYTKPAILLNGRFISSNRAYITKQKKWKHEITLQFKWCTS